MFKQLVFPVAMAFGSVALLHGGCAGTQNAGPGDDGTSVAVPGSGGRRATGGGPGASGTGGSAPVGSGGVVGTGGATGSGGAPGSGSTDAGAGDDAAAPAGSDAASGGEGANPAPPAAAAETLAVPGDGSAVTSKTTLAVGELYLLKASGAVGAGGQQVDAEYGFGAGMPADEVSGMDVGIDVGRLQIHPKVHTTATPPGPGRMKWGPAGATFRDDHVYYMLLTGDGKPLALKLASPAKGAGTIAVSLLQLSPAPPKTLGTELETIMVPLLKVMVTTKVTTTLGKPYILQAAGTGQVSKGGIGDAEYMDFDVEGTKFNEGESGADFGIGVDELDVGVRPGGGATYKPRLRWWGPWRKDHTYYMIFIGTGKPIQLLYFDSGYGDNSPTDAIPLKVFPAP